MILLISTWKSNDVTEDDKNFFDTVFVDFIDQGHTSEFYNAEIYNQGEILTRIGYSIDLSDFTNKMDLIINAPTLTQLSKYSDNYNEYILDLKSCLDKIKEEYWISEYLDSVKKVKLKLTIYGRKKTSD